MIKLFYYYIRFFPVRKGKFPLLLLGSRLGIFKGQVRRTRLSDHTFVDLKLDDWVQQIVYFFGRYEFEKHETAAWTRQAAKSSVIADIGSNFGYYSLIATDVNPQCTIHAFEPAPKTYQSLVKNIHLNNYKNIRAHNIGLSDTNGVLPLYLASDTNTGMTSLSRPSDYSGSSVNVDVKVFDEFAEQNHITSLDLVKIDVEGNEFNVLKGMERSIAAFRPVFFIEILQNNLETFKASRDDIFNFFKARNYKCIEYSKNGTPVEITEPKDIGLAVFYPPEKNTFK